MRVLLFGTLTAAVTFLHPTAATQNPPVASTLSGRVVTMAGAEQRPVRHAKVTLTGRGVMMPRIADTDTRGAYRFDRLPAGDYRIAVQKAGFVRLETDVHPDATLTMVRAGAIEGTVTDAAGDPVWNVAVTALQTQPDGAAPKTVAQVRTDDLGQYRLHSLAEGDYYVEAATDPVFLMTLFLTPGEKRPDVNRSYFPASATMDQAKPIHVTQGQDSTAMHLTFTPSAPFVDPSAPPAPPRPDATGTARIAGRIVDASSGKPIKDAQLLLLPVEGQRLTNWKRTDAQGRFEYGSLQAQRYTLRAQADRFVTLEFGQKRQDETGTQIVLRDGETFTANIALPRGTAIEGTLADEFGDPSPNVMVQTARKQYAAGRHRLMPTPGRLATSVTDDRGHYRISGLPPGEYYVAGLSGAYTDSNEVGGFAPTYYPGTPDPGAAVPVMVGIGADAAASFALVPARTFTISGTMVDGEGKPVAGRGTLWLATPDRLQRMDFNMARAITTADGRFVLRNVPEGSYTMQGFGPPPQGYKGPGNLAAMPFGWSPVTVADTNIEDLALKLTTGTALRGKFVLEDDALPRPKSGEVHVLPIPVEFDSSPVGGGPPPFNPREDLTFEVTNLSGMRRIVVSVSSPQWALKKITQNDLDITDTPLDFRAKDVESVEVHLTSKVTRLAGGVSDDKGPVADYAVVVFASDPAKWIDRSRFVAMTRPTQQGRFEVRGLPPEEYFVVALPGVVANEWQDPDFLQQLRPQATTITLLEGESKTVDLKLKRRP
jgi:5-hydroxyisourate hydrolase-like protein (transthyretin family)